MKSLVLALISTVAALAATPFSTVTFDKDVLPIMQKNCQSCHRPGEIGPMPLLTYENTRPWAKAIKEAVLTKKMPPWFADPRFGHFANDRRLTEADVKTLVYLKDEWNRALHLLRCDLFVIHAKYAGSTAANIT